MTKVVYNACYGGFGLSNEAIELILAKKGIEFVKSESNSLYTTYETTDGEHLSVSDLERTDPVLVEVVETLGDKANGSFAELRVEDVPEGTLYRIDEYDGYESVMTQDSYDWRIA